MKIYFFNSPKRSGKDTVAETIVGYTDVIGAIAKFSEPLYNSIRTIFSIEPETWDYMYEFHKESPSPKLMGMTPREAMIWLSEDVMKPKFGVDFYGNVMVNKIKTVEGTDIRILIPDSGFFTEAKPVMDYFGVENCFHIYLNREGTGFDHTDSRSYWGNEAIEYGMPLKNIMVVDNNQAPQYAASKILELTGG